MRMSMLRVEKTPDDEGEAGNCLDANGRRTDEWSQCLGLIAKNEDRAAFTRLF